MILQKKKKNHCYEWMRRRMEKTAKRVNDIEDRTIETIEFEEH